MAKKVTGIICKCLYRLRPHILYVLGTCLVWGSTCNFIRIELTLCIFPLPRITSKHCDIFWYTSDTPETSISLNANFASKIPLIWFCRSWKIIRHVFFLFSIWRKLTKIQLVKDAVTPKVENSYTLLLYTFDVTRIFDSLYSSVNFYQIEKEKIRV